MTRAELEKEYQVNEAGGITNPGKFEGEPLFVPYLWDSTMEGTAEEIVFAEGEPIYFSVEITPEDIKEFPELEGKTEVVLWESEQGFVQYSDDAGMIAKLKTDAEKYAEDENARETEFGVSTARALVASVIGKEYHDVNDKLRVASILSQAMEKFPATDQEDGDTSLDANASLKLLASSGYTDLLASERARELLGMATKNFWKESHREIKKRFEKQMMDEVKRVQRWGTNPVGEFTIKEIIKRTLQENNIYPYPKLLELVYKNPFAEESIVPQPYSDGKTVHEE